MKAKEIKGTKSNKIVEQQGRNLPKTIFTKWVWRESNDPFIEATDDIAVLAEKDQTDYVGEYRLVKTGKVSLKLEVK